MPETMRLSVQGVRGARKGERDGSLARRSGRRGSRCIRTWMCSVSMLVAAACTAGEEVSEPAAEDRDDAAEGHLSRYLAGLDETVTLVKEGFSSYAIRADGSISSVQELYEQERAAYRVRFGAMAKGLHDRVRTSDPATRMRVAVYFDEAVPGGPTAGMLRSPDPADRQTARAGAEASIASARRQLEPLLARAGFRATSAGRYIPAVFGSVAAGKVEVIARDPRVREDVPDDVRARILEVQDKAGFVPNVFLVLARRPDEFRAFFAYHDALMLKEGGLSKAEREMIVVATSAAHHCLYCVVAHGAILRIYDKDPLIADQVAVNHRKADLTPRRRAMLDFAMKVSLHSDEIEDADFARLREHGFTDEEAWDIAAIAAFFAMSNRMANMSSQRPNDEFYLMGRVPRT